MGGSLSFNVGADSIAEPGKKSIVCDGIDGVDADKLFAAFEDHIRDGKTANGKEASFEVAPHDGGYLDVHKYDVPEAYGGGSFTTRNHFRFDAATRTLTQKHYVNDGQFEQGTPAVIQTLMVHAEPTKIEFWCDSQPYRLAGKMLQGAMQYAFKEFDITAKVNVEQPSIAAPGSKSCISDEIPEAECAAGDWMDKFKAMLVDKLGATELPDGTVIEDRSGLLEMVNGLKSFAKHTFDADAGRVDTYEYGEDESLSELRRITTMQVHKGPFRIEMWTESQAGRFATETELRNMKPLVEKVLTALQGKA